MTCSVRPPCFGMSSALRSSVGNATMSKAYSTVTGRRLVARCGHRDSGHRNSEMIFLAAQSQIMIGRLTPTHPIPRRLEFHTKCWWHCLSRRYVSAPKGIFKIGAAHWCSMGRQLNPQHKWKVICLPSAEDSRVFCHAEADVAFFINARQPLILRQLQYRNFDRERGFLWVDYEG